MLDPITQWIADADEYLIRVRMENTGESEEECRAVVQRIRAKATPQSTNTLFGLMMQRKRDKYARDRKRLAAANATVKVNAATNRG